MEKNDQHLAFNSELDLATHAKVASKRCRTSKTQANSFSIDEILNFIRRFRQNGRYLSPQEFGCTEYYEFGSGEALKPMAQHEFAIKWLFELLRSEKESLFDQVLTWRPGRLDSTSNRAALESLKSHLFEQNPNSKTSFFRIDRPKDHSGIPCFRNRALGWFIACLRASYPVLFSYPIYFDQGEMSMYESDPYQLQWPTKKTLLASYVPAVAFAKTTTIYNHEKNLDSIQHGIRCRLFFPNNETCVLTVPDYYFYGLVRDCWLIIDPKWSGRIDLDHQTTTSQP